MLHARGVRHAGIAYCHQHARTIGGVLSAPVLLWQVMEPQEMANRVEYLRASDRHVLAPGSRRYNSGQGPSIPPENIR